MFGIPSFSYYFPTCLYVINIPCIYKEMWAEEIAKSAFARPEWEGCVQM